MPVFDINTHVNTYYNNDRIILDLYLISNKIIPGLIDIIYIEHRV